MSAAAAVTLLAGFLTFAAVAVALVRAAWSLYATHRDLAIVIGRLWDIADHVEAVPDATDRILRGLREGSEALERVKQATRTRSSRR